ncbi:MAG: hypothetical protein JWM68_4305 [Verrucomicrobiales bacterium]|nr:hypothetical protein [Verrucomicrobiales bacterium]
MKTVSLRGCSSRHVFPLFALVIIAIATSTQADQIDLKNGDRYSGKVVALESNTVVLSNDIIGTVRLSRDRIASISFGAKPIPGTARSAAPKAPPVPVVANSAGPNPQIDLNSSLGHQIAANPNLVSEVRSQVLAGAGPQAMKKYDTLIGGLSTGSLNMANLHNEAASVAAQLRQLRSSGDEESAAIFDEYLGILDSFLAKTTPANTPATPTLAAKPPVSQTLKPWSPPAAQKPTAALKPEDE